MDFGAICRFAFLFRITRTITGVLYFLSAARSTRIRAHCFHGRSFSQLSRTTSHSFGCGSSGFVQVFAPGFGLRLDVLVNIRRLLYLRVNLQGSAVAFTSKAQRKQTCENNTYVCVCCVPAHTLPPPECSLLMFGAELSLSEHLCQCAGGSQMNAGEPVQAPPPLLLTVLSSPLLVGLCYFLMSYCFIVFTKHYIKIYTLCTE